MPSSILGPAIDLVVLALAVWRLSYLIVAEDGPFNIFPRLKAVLGVRFVPEADVLSDTSDEPMIPLDAVPKARFKGDHYEYGYLIPRNVVARALMCVYCLSVWIGLGAAIAYYAWAEAAILVAFPLALSGLALVVHHFGGN